VGGGRGGRKGKNGGLNPGPLHIPGKEEGRRLRKIQVLIPTRRQGEEERGEKRVIHRVWIFQQQRKKGKTKKGKK